MNNSIWMRTMLELILLGEHSKRILSEMDVHFVWGEDSRGVPVKISGFPVKILVDATEKDATDQDATHKSPHKSPHKFQFPVPMLKTASELTMFLLTGDFDFFKGYTKPFNFPSTVRFYLKEDLPVGTFQHWPKESEVGTFAKLPIFLESLSCMDSSQAIYVNSSFWRERLLPLIGDTLVCQGNLVFARTWSDLEILGVCVNSSGRYLRAADGEAVLESIKEIVLDGGEPVQLSKKPRLSEEELRQQRIAVMEPLRVSMLELIFREDEISMIYGYVQFGYSPQGAIEKRKASVRKYSEIDKYKIEVKARLAMLDSASEQLNVPGEWVQWLRSQKKQYKQDIKALDELFATLEQFV